MHVLMSDESLSSPPDDPEATSPAEAPSSAGESVIKKESGNPTDEFSGESKPTHSAKSEEGAKSDSASSTETLSVMTGTVSGLERLIKRSFTSPESTKAACRALIESADDKGQWLASLVQPAHLTEELRQSSSDLSTLVIMQWVRQGETHKLKQLGDILLLEEPSKTTRESAQIMAVLAGLLGILRPMLAQRLLSAATPHLKELSDKSLIQDARQWVEAGGLLEGCIPEQRVFWNRRLREPNADWDWDSTEARLSLSHLSGKRVSENADLDLFQNAVPGCWWDLWRSPKVGLITGSAESHSHRVEARTKKYGGFVGGLVAGSATALALGWWLYSNAEQQVTSNQSDRSTPFIFEEESVPTPPVRESLRQLQAVLKKETSNSTAITKNQPATVHAAFPDVVAPHAKASVSQQATTKEQLRKQAANDFAISHPDIRRLFTLVKQGSYRENEPLIQGQNSLAPGGSPAYQHLIHWLVLDPPEQADTRLVVTKMAVRCVPIPDLVALFELCYYQGSPNQIEVKQCSTLLLELPIQDMTAEQKSRLLAISSAP
jgi:hypothetical protein